MKNAICVLVVLILLSGCNPVTPPITDTTYRALLIGVGDYPGCKNDLDSPFYNVRNMQTMFEDSQPFSLINTLTDSDATKKAIVDEIYYTFHTADSDDVSYIYYNGHGGNCDDGSCLLPYDFDDEVLTVHELAEELEKIEGDKVVILDTCHSGGFIGKAYYDALALLSEIPNCYTITACSSDQYAWEINESVTVPEPFCVFTKAITTGVGYADVDKDGIITLSEIYEFAIWWIEETFNNDTYWQDVQVYPEGSTFPFLKD